MFVHPFYYVLSNHFTVLLLMFVEITAVDFPTTIYYFAVAGIFFKSALAATFAVFTVGSNGLTGLGGA